jgi:hypothetical protein
MVNPRRFPLPWRIGETDACFFVQDASGHRLAYIYFVERRPGYSVDVTKMTRAEAHLIARNIVKLPELLQAASERDT